VVVSEFANGVHKFVIAEGTLGTL